MLKIIKSGIQGICIGSTILVISGIFFTEGSIQMLFLSLVLMSLLIGLLSNIYNYKKIPLLLQVVIHVSGCFGVFLMTAYINKWFPFQVDIVLQASLIFLLIFFSIWTIFYLKATKEIAAINNHLK